MSDRPPFGPPGGGDAVAYQAAIAALVKAQSVMTPGTLARMPNQPKTPIKCFRIPEDLYRAAQAKAEERGETLSNVVRSALERYVRSKR